MSISTCISRQQHSLILAHPEWNWDWEEFSYSIDFEFLLAHPDLDYDWVVISRRFANKAPLYTDFPWIWGEVTKSVSLTLINRYPDRPWVYYLLSEASQERVVLYPNIKWTRYDANQIDIEFVIAHLDANWDMKLLHECFGWDEATQYPAFPWVQEYCFDWMLNGDMPPLSFILSHLDWDWPWEDLYDNCHITRGFLEAHPQIKWKPELIEVEDEPAIDIDQPEEQRHILEKWSPPSLDLSLNDFIYHDALTPELLTSYLVKHGPILSIHKEKNNRLWHKLSDPKAFATLDGIILIQRVYRQYRQRRCKELYSQALGVTKVVCAKVVSMPIPLDMVREIATMVVRELRYQRY